MNVFFKSLPLSSAALIASAVAASAQERSWWLGDIFGGLFGNGWHDQTPTHSVPEIDASSGLMAGAAVLAALVLTWEIRRRRRS